MSNLNIDSLRTTLAKKHKLNQEEAMVLARLIIDSGDTHFLGDSEVYGDGEFFCHFWTKDGYIAKIHCRYYFPNPKILKDFSNLRKLEILSGDCGDISDLGNIVSLEVLILEQAEFKDVDDLRFLSSLINLKELRLICTTIKEIKYFGNLKNLKTLVISADEDPDWNGYLNEVKGLNNLKNLKSLDLSANRIKEIKGLDSLINLEHLNLSNNMITDIKGLKFLSKLKTLYLSDNQISEIKGLDSLKELEILSLSDNRINMIKNLGSLRNLIIVGLRNNSFKVVEAYYQYKKGFFNDYIFKKYLISIVASQEEDEQKMKALEYLEELTPTEQNIWRYLINSLVFHRNNKDIKIKTIEILANNYLSISVETIKNFIKTSNSQDFMKKIYDILKPIESKESEQLIRFVNEYRKGS